MLRETARAEAFWLLSLRRDPPFEAFDDFGSIGMAQQMISPETSKGAVWGVIRVHWSWLSWGTSAAGANSGGR